MRRFRTPLLLVLAVALSAPASSHAGPGQDYLDVYGAYKASGAVDGCAFSARKLASAQQGVPPDVETYAPELPGAIDAALRSRTGGDCDEPAAPAGAAPASGAPTTPAPAPEAGISPRADDGSVAAAADRSRGSTAADDAPFPLVALAVLAVAAAIAGLLWALARFVAFDPPWLAAGRHATSEAGWRASASWADFADWLRLGR